MAAVPGLDELLRAAEAAGFAMAAPDEGLASVSPIAPAVKTASVEDLARGARDVRTVQFGSAATGAIAAQASRTSAPTMRETVYGYLRFGVPA
jgi:hypothetical protein